MTTITVANCYPDWNRGGSALTFAACGLARGLGANRLRVQSITDPGPGGYAAEYRHTLGHFPEARIEEPIGVHGRESASLGRRVVVAGSSHTRALFARSQWEDHGATDMVLGRGGVIFRSGFNMRSAAMLYLRLTPLLLAPRAGIPTVIYGAHIDPIRYAPARHIAGSALEAAELVIVRDEVSAENARALTSSMKRLIVAPDSVFALSESWLDGLPDDLVPRAWLASRFAVVCLSGGERGGFAEREKEVASRLAAALDRILRQGLVDRVLVLAQRNDPASGDAKEGKRFASMIGPAATFLSEDLSPTQLMGLYREAALVTGTRLHSTILALAAGGLGAPIDMGPSHRMPAVYEEVGLREFVATELMSPGQLAEHLTGLVEDREKHLKTVAQALVQARSRLSGAATEIGRLFAS